MLALGGTSWTTEDSLFCFIEMDALLLLSLLLQSFHASWKVLDFLNKVSWTWKVLRNELGPGKYWKLSLKVLESPGIYLWFNLTNMPFMYRTPRISKCMKYSCYV